MRWSGIVIPALLILFGCAQPEPSITPAVELKASASPPKKTPFTQVLIITSEDIPAYSEVAKALAKQLGRRANIIYLSSSTLENINTLGKFKNDERMQFVSIGLNAAIAAKSLPNKQVVFCQVYNYQDYALLSPMHKGVSMLPSFQKTFGNWRALSPEARHIGVISGPGLGEMIHTAKAAAKSHGFTLHHKTVNTDKEYQYAFKTMSADVQGYLILPDNRVLSENILRDTMTYSVRNSKQIAVFNNELLKLGGLLSLGSDYQDIAQQVLDRLEQGQAKDTLPGPDIVYIEKLNVRINSVMAARLGIQIPERLRKYASAP